MSVLRAGILLMGLAGFLAPTGAAAAPCADDLTPKSGIRAVLDCIKDMNREIEALKAQSRRMVSVPPDAVIAVAFPKGCPAGWRQFEEANGRFIVGAGAPPVTRELRPPSERFFGEKGGEETVTLSVQQMPSHTHSLRRTDQAPKGDGNFVDWRSMGSPNNKSTGDAITATGGGQAHNNMPPFIALYFCKKDY